MKKFESFYVFGVFISFACAVHCMLMPILIMFIPLVFLTDGINKMSLVISTLLSLPSLCFGFKKHTRVSPMIILSLGFLCLNTDCRSKYHIAISIIGGVCFLTSYLLNKQLCKKCNKCSH